MRLVYVSGPRGPHAQKWPDDMPINDGGKQKHDVLMVFDLKLHEEILTIAELKRIYPWGKT